MKLPYIYDNNFAHLIHTPYSPENMGNNSSGGIFQEQNRLTGFQKEEGSEKQKKVKLEEAATRTPEDGAGRAHSPEIKPT